MEYELVRIIMDVDVNASTTTEKLLCFFWFFYRMVAEYATCTCTAMSPPYAKPETVVLFAAMFSRGIGIAAKATTWLIVTSVTSVMFGIFWKFCAIKP